MFRLFKKRSRADINEQRYKKWLAAYVPATTNTKIELEVCFTDQRGNNFYRLKNPAHLSRERAQAIEESLKAIEYGISKTELEERLKSVLDKINEISWNSAKKEELKRLQETARTEIGEFLYRMQTVTIDDLIIQSGLYFLYVDNENPYHISPETQQRKWDLVKSDDELRAFFLMFMEQVLRASSSISAETSQR